LKPLRGASLDAPLPLEMALACEAAGVSKAGRDAVSLLMLGILAGAFIALGALFMTVVVSGAPGLPFGLTRLLAGVAFSLGLILVIVGGAELFTGDTLMVMAWAGRRIGTAALARAWYTVFLGNIVGAVGTALLVFLAGHHRFGAGIVGRSALTIADYKAALPVQDVFFLAILCNVLVCLAVWMSFSGRSVVDKVAVIVPPIAAFVAAGFEHSIANIYFFSYGLLLKLAEGPAFWALIGAQPAEFSALTTGSALRNLAMATLGNLLGGSVFVGAVYWFIYLRRNRAVAPRGEGAGEGK
jgi:formate/nitrite transporter